MAQRRSGISIELNSTSVLLHIDTWHMCRIALAFHSIGLIPDNRLKRCNTQTVNWNGTLRLGYCMVML